MMVNLGKEMKCMEIQCLSSHVWGLVANMFGGLWQFAPLVASPCSGRESGVGGFCICHLYLFYDHHFMAAVVSGLRSV